MSEGGWEGETALREARTQQKGDSLDYHGYDSGHDTWNVKATYDNDDSVVAMGLLLPEKSGRRRHTDTE